MTTAPTALAKWPAVSARAIPSGCRSPGRSTTLASKSPSKIAAHQRNPPTYSRTIPTPVAGQKAPTPPVSNSASPRWLVT
jgi:hypothetical protein